MFTVTRWLFDSAKTQTKLMSGVEALLIGKPLIKRTPSTVTEFEKDKGVQKLSKDAEV